MPQSLNGGGSTASESTKSKRVMVKDRDLLQITSRFKDQVAGHFSGLLHWSHEGKDILFKRGEDRERLEREIRFYEDVQSLPLHHPSSAAALVPKYYGLLETEKHSYIVLESVTSGMGQAVVADIKIGRVAFGLTASSHKRFSEAKKCSQMHAWGYRVSGLRGYDGEEVSKRRKNRSLSEHPKTYLSLLFPEDCPAYLSEEVIRQIEVVLRWGRRQDRYNIQSASLLIAFDRLEQQPPRVALIDFAHTFPACSCNKSDSIAGRVRRQGGRSMTQCGEECDLWENEWVWGCERLIEDIREVAGLEEEEEEGEEEEEDREER